MSRRIYDTVMGTRRGSSGFALLMVLMLIAIASVLGISYIYGAQVKTAGTVNLMLASEARYLAESGLQHGLYALQTRALPFASEAAPNGPYHVSPGDGGYVFYSTATATPNDYRIVATGTAGGISQTVSMTVRLTSDYAKKMVDLEPEYWWRLGDSGLTAVDQEGHNDGVYVNGVARGAEGALLGDIDTAADFPGSNDYVNLGKMNKVDYDRVVFGAWVRADGWATANPRIISRASGVNAVERRWELAVSDTRRVRFTLRLKDFIYILYGNTPLQLGQWCFVVGTFDKGARQMRLYLNGEPDGTRSGTVDERIKDDDNLEAWIGDCPPWSGQRTWDGPIDEVFIMKNEMLTEAAVKELYDARIPGVEVISWDD